MAKAKGCKVGTVKFKTRRGRTIEFHGKHGPSCGPRRFRRTAWNNKIAAAGRACKKAGRPGTAKNAACLRAHLRG